MIHGAECDARTFRTRCWYCGKPAFLFTCDCGSGVLFEELGRGWPQHVCAQELIAESGASPQELAQLVQQRARELGVADAELHRLLARQGLALQVTETFKEQVEQRRAVKPEIRRVDPAGGQRTIRGIVREVLTVAAPANKIGVKPGSLGDKEFRRRIPKSVLQITIHCGDIAVADAESYTVWIPDGEAARAYGKRERVVKADIVPVAIPGAKSFWLVLSLGAL